ncbi:MAG TPA: hypothetical protein VFC46_04775, partial [Humisphaera sp.]|nr:hypothetical protein [Humisphaera sp.]
TIATSITVVVPENENHHEASGALVGVDTVNNTITIQGEHSAIPTTYTLDPAATITLNHVAGTLGALPIGADVELTLATNGTTALTVSAHTQQSENHGASGSLVSVDTVNNTITIQTEHSATPTIYTLDPMATIALNGASSTLGALPIGADIGLTLNLAGTAVLSVKAETPEPQDVYGSLVSVDTVNNTITIQSEHSQTPTTYTLAPMATITLNGAADTFGALPIGASIHLTVTPNTTTALTVNAQTQPAQGQHANGALVSVNTVNNTIAIQTEHSQMPTTYTLDPMATITLNGVASTLGALPIGINIQLTLAANGTTALSIKASADD